MARVLGSSRMQRVGFAIVSLSTSAVLVAGCSSSGGGKPAGGNTGSTTGATTPGSTTAPAGPASSTSSAPSLGNLGALSGLCKDYVAESAKLSQEFTSALQGGSTSSAISAEIALFDKYAAQAPSEIKSSFQAIAKALRDIQSKDTAALQADAPALSTASQKLTTYFATNCK